MGWALFIIALSRPLGNPVPKKIFRPKKGPRPKGGSSGTRVAYYGVLRFQAFLPRLWGAQAYTCRPPAFTASKSAWISLEGGWVSRDAATMHTLENKKAGNSS